MKLCDWENYVYILQVKIFYQLCDSFVRLSYYYINGHVMKREPIYLGKESVKIKGNSPHSCGQSSVGHALSLHLKKMKTQS